jgi:GTP pyrophosphokinase
MKKAMISQLPANEAIDLVDRAQTLAEHLLHGLTTFYGQPYIEHGLEISNVLRDLQLDQETIAAGILTHILRHRPTAIALIKKQLGTNVSKLLLNVEQMDIIPSLHQQQHQITSTQNKAQLDKLRKMLLSMATDIRTVIIKLTERLVFMRGIKKIPSDEQQRYAREILDIYAPLANRLGIGQLKWELEDIAFHYLQPITYKAIASQLSERRSDRVLRIQSLIQFISQKLTENGIQANVTGRAKHIYSIYLKMQRKHVDYHAIYDTHAVRILVPTISACYQALSLMHSIWPPIIAEFDDYIAHPKENGYRSIHTAVMGSNQKHFEIQIRTTSMHEEAERGIAAHWLYKEKEPYRIDDATKMVYLQQLLNWQRDMMDPTHSQSEKDYSLFSDQIYVITPAGDIIDLPQGATPLDFAYHIHTDLGHRCRGAKVNDQIVPLTYSLKNADKIEIITHIQSNPSRDWLNHELGYLKTRSARNKIRHWFKQKAQEEAIQTGKHSQDKEHSPRHLLTHKAKLAIEKAPSSIAIQKTMATMSGKAITGGSDYLTRFAKCCKPIPGDDIIGYITLGSGITIHKTRCRTLCSQRLKERLIAVDWNPLHIQSFNCDLTIIAALEEQKLSEITSILHDEKIDIVRLNSTFHKYQQRLLLALTINVTCQAQLQQVMQRIKNIPGVLSIKRATQ